MFNSHHTLLWKISVCCLLVVSYAGRASCDQPWKAKWISPSSVDTDTERLNSWHCFYSPFQLQQAPSEFPLRIACDSKYWLWVNGKLAVREGGLKRGPSPTGTYYDTVDVAAYTKAGVNHIGVLVWHFGKHGFSHNDSGKVGLILEGPSNQPNVMAEPLLSCGRWKTKRHPAYQTADMPPPNYRLPEQNLRFDARESLGDWQRGETSADWPAAVAVDDADSVWGTLHPRPIGQWKDYGVRDYQCIIETPAKEIHLKSPFTRREIYSKDERTAHVARLPYNCHVHPIMEIVAQQPGLVIGIETDNIRTGGEWLLRTQYVTKQGPQTYELPLWLNGHEVRYLIPQGVQVKSLSYRETGYDAEFVGKFSSSYERLNLLWEKSRRTLYVTMRDTYMDCPDRERAQWWGDAVNELGEAFYIFDGKNGPRLARKAILELAAFQREDNTLYSPVPAGVPDPTAEKKTQRGTWSSELPRQMLASVGYYGFWTYYKYSGDKATIQTVYPAVKRYLSVWQLDDRGLAVHRKGQWDWTDWGENMDVAVLENAWLHLALRGALEMAELLEQEDDARRYRHQMTRIESAFNRTFWQGDFYRSPGHQGETDDRANALAVVAGLADVTYYPAITKFLETNTHASPYMEKYVLESLYLMQQPDVALDRTLQRYQSMIDCPHSTLWENFARAGHDEPGSGTYNHAWSGGPLTMMHQYVAGVEPIEPAFKRFSVRPQLGRLTHVETTVPTIFSEPIKLTISKTQQQQSIDLLVPEGTTAEVHLYDQTKTFQPGKHRWTVEQPVEGGE